MDFAGEQPARDGRHTSTAAGTHAFPRRDGSSTTSEAGAATDAPVMDIVPYSARYRQAVERMNSKLAAAGSEWRFDPEERPPDADRRPVWTESFIAVEGDEVYGGYILKHQTFFLEGDPHDVGNLQLPLSLGQIDSVFANVSVALLFDAMRRSPRLYSLGLGSPETQFARLLGAARFQSMAVPFYFSVKSANRFADQIRLSPDAARLQRVLRVLGAVRLAGAALAARRRAASRGRPRVMRGVYDRVEQTATLLDVDELFGAEAASYSLVGDRRASALGCVYPDADARFIRLLVHARGGVVGWAVVLDTRMRNHRYFGDLRVGTLVDCFAEPSNAPAVAAAVDDFLGERGVDLVISNQLHAAWGAALERAGYETGPSNFFFYVSEELSAELSRIESWEGRAHVNRGDGEGPENL